MSDNTFATARDIGSFGASGGSILARGRIGRFDPVDVYRFTIRAGSAFNAQASTLVRGGSLNFSTYFKSPETGRITLAQTVTIPPSNGTSTTAFPSLPMNGTFYIKFDRPTQNVNYRVSFTSLAT
jgi:hypothetical protein